MSEATGDVLDRFCAGDDPEFLRRDAAELLVSNFASYGIELLDAADAERLQAAWDEDGDPSAVVRSLPIKRVVPHIQEMLDYYLIRKVIGPAGFTGQLAATYADLARFLGEEGAIPKSLATKLAKEVDRAAEVIPRAERLNFALHDLTRQLVGNRPSPIDREEIVEDSLVIERVEPGKVWFEGGIGPFEVPESVSAESETGWEVWIAAAPADGRWHLLECGMVYP